MPVLDASAILTYLGREAGHERVVTHLDGGIVSTVNWSEVCQKIRARAPTAARAIGMINGLRALGLRIVPFTIDEAELAAELYERTKAAGLSLADRACIAVGMTFDEPVITADHAWVDIAAASLHGSALAVTIEVIRDRPGTS